MGLGLAFESKVCENDVNMEITNGTERISERRVAMERERDPATIELLKNLRARLLSENISVARVAAYNLSWLQEDGLTLLKEALFGDYPKTAKKAAAYGLRNMKGRMKKMAIEVLQQGRESSDEVTREACAKSLYLMENKPKRKMKKQSPHSAKARRKIKEVPSKDMKQKRRFNRKPFNR